MKEHRANRCTPCDTNWPMGNVFKERCPACGLAVWPVDDKPDHTYLEAQSIMASSAAWSTTATPEEIAADLPMGEGYVHRLARFMALGFDEINGGLLATATVISTTVDKRGTLKWETPLHHMTVAAALNAGMSHHDVVQLYA